MPPWSLLTTLTTVIVGLLVAVGQGAGLALAERDGDIAVAVAVTGEAVEGVAGQQGLAGGVGAGIDRDRHAAGDGIAFQGQLEVIGWAVPPLSLLTTLTTVM